MQFPDYPIDDDEQDPARGTRNWSGLLTALAVVAAIILMPLALAVWIVCGRGD